MRRVIRILANGNFFDYIAHMFFLLPGSRCLSKGIRRGAHGRFSDNVRLFADGSEPQRSCDAATFGAPRCGPDGARLSGFVRVSLANHANDGQHR